MSDLYLFARIAGTAVAIPTDEIEAVVRLTHVSPVPGVNTVVVGLSALRSRVLTVLDAAALIIGERSDDRDWSEEGRLAIMCEIGSHSYGLLVDAVEDVMPLESAPLAPCGKIDPLWAEHVCGVVDHKGQPYFLISVAALLEGGGMAQVA